MLMFILVIYLFPFLMYVFLRILKFCAILLYCYEITWGMQYSCIMWFGLLIFVVLGVQGKINWLVQFDN
ncbi:hypothetical protein V1522DRAFT_401413 [Lipomyces starkeyi]